MTDPQTGHPSADAAPDAAPGAAPTRTSGGAPSDPMSGSASDRAPRAAAQPAARPAARPAAPRVPGATPPPAGHRPASRRLVLVGVAVSAALALVAALVFGLTRDAREPVTPGPDAGTQAPRDGGSAARAGELLTWAPPRLSDPTVVEVSAENRSLELEPDTDYLVRMPDEPLEVTGGLVINGGRNVVLIGGEIRVSERGERDLDMRGLYLQNQTGTLHIEGLLITGDELAEGINIDQREGATVQLQNIRVDTVRGEEEGHHADVIQTWAGPSVLRVDRLTGSTTYQGFFLLPKQFIDEDPELFDLRNVNLVGEDGAGYLLWRDEDDWPLTVENVWVDVDRDAEDRDSFLWARGDDSADTWADVQVGTPPGGDFVPADSVGVGYRSPGYLDGDD